LGGMTNVKASAGSRAQPPPQPATPPAEVPSASVIEEKIDRFRSFIDERLKVDLKSTLDARDKIYEKISQYLELQRNIEILDRTGAVNLKTMVNLGCEFQVQAVVPDARTIFVDLGLGFWVELTLGEARQFIAKKEASLNMYAHFLFLHQALPQLQNLKLDIRPLPVQAWLLILCGLSRRRAEVLSKQAAHISSLIKMVYEGIAELMNIPLASDEDHPPRRQMF